MARRDGPGIWWQFLEFMGMTWPGHKAKAVRPSGPPCPACGNPSQQGDDQRFHCAHHPHASIPDPE